MYFKSPLLKNIISIPTFSVTSPTINRSITMRPFTFRGLMSPVFTFFNDDEKQSVNYDAIEPYAKYLKEKGVDGVLVNGTSGEGMSMNVQERKKTAEKWYEACKKFGLTLMIQVGGAPFVDVAELAAHADQLKVDAILCLPELYFKPTTEEALVKYMKNVSSFCKNTALLYYHIPMFAGVNLFMPKFITLAEAEIPNFVGIKYTSGDLAQGAACLNDKRFVFLGADTILCGAIAQGFDSSIMTTLNICPELSIAIVDNMKKGNVTEALRIQKDLTGIVNEILKKGDWVTAMKYAFNEMELPFHVGVPRKPL